MRSFVRQPLSTRRGHSPYSWRESEVRLALVRGILFRAMLIEYEQSRASLSFASVDIEIPVDTNDRSTTPALWQMGM